MVAPAVTAPSPSPVGSLDPFAPDPTVWPEAPGWLFPAVMTAFAIVAIAALVLLYMWLRSVRYEREAKAAKGPTQWVDLSKLDRTGHWEDDDPTPNRHPDT